MRGRQLSYDPLSYGPGTMLMQSLHPTACAYRRNTRRRPALSVLVCWRDLTWVQPSIDTFDYITQSEDGEP